MFNYVYLHCAVFFGGFFLKRSLFLISCYTVSLYTLKNNVFDVLETSKKQTRFYVSLVLNVINNLYKITIF